jgi:ADP-ribose pyrophosphatase YjhB (NUDIX family)
MTALQARNGEQYLQAHKAWRRWRSLAYQVEIIAAGVAAVFHDPKADEDVRAAIHAKMDRLPEGEQEYMVQFAAILLLEERGKITRTMAWHEVWPLLWEQEQELFTIPEA